MTRPVSLPVSVPGELALRVRSAATTNGMAVSEWLRIVVFRAYKGDETAAVLVNERIVHTLSCGVDVAVKPRHQIACEAGMHKNILLCIDHDEDPNALDEAARSLADCEVPPCVTLALVLARNGMLAALSLHHETGVFIKEFHTALPGELYDALGDWIGELRLRWAISALCLVSGLLSEHFDEFADRDLSLAISR